MGSTIETLWSQRPNHDIQWPYDDQWEPIFSLLLKKGNRTNLEVDKEKSMINKFKTQEYQMKYGQSDELIVLKILYQ